MSSNVIWWNGKLVPWDNACVHVTSETALRGLNVFEGLRAYWRASENAFAIVGTDAHMKRLIQSAQSLAIPVHDASPRLRQGMSDILQTITTKSDLYLRPTIYIESGVYEVDEAKIICGEFISWRYAPSSPFRTIRCGISKWRRLPPDCLPSSAKVGAAYTSFRLARLDAKAQGYDEAILLNEMGRITETGGGSVFIVKNAIVITPPLEEGILPSITRRIVLDTLCPSLTIETEQRPLNVSDILEADEVFIAGTLDEISQVVAVNNVIMPQLDSGSIVQALQIMYYSLCNGSKLRDSGWIDIISVEE
jgi:branched-chain amino acid aminotransferase